LKTLPNVFVAVRKVGAKNQTKFSKWVSFQKKYFAANLFSGQTQYNLRTQVKKVSEKSGKKLLKVRKKWIFLQITSSRPIVLLEMLIEVLTNPLSVCAPEFRNSSVEVQINVLFQMMTFPYCVFSDTWNAALKLLHKISARNQKLFVKN